MYVDLGRYVPLEASSYIELPDYLKRKHCIVNVVNSDDACLKWAVLSCLYPVVKNANRVSSYHQHEQQLIVDGKLGFFFFFCLFLRYDREKHN